MNIIRAEKSARMKFTIMSNDVIYDSKLSWKAKGILAYLLSRPDDWIFNLPEISKHAKDGKDCARSGIKELMDNGYINRKQIRGESGKILGYLYKVFEKPNMDSPTMDSSTLGNPTLENPTVLNTDFNNTELNNTDFIYIDFTKKEVGKRGVIKNDKCRSYESTEQEEKWFSEEEII